MSGLHQPGTAVQGGPEIVALALQRLATVNPHPHEVADDDGPAEPHSPTPMPPSIFACLCRPDIRLSASSSTQMWNAVRPGCESKSIEPPSHPMTIRRAVGEHFR
jgi:hypothetical protein